MSGLINPRNESTINYRRKNLLLALALSPQTVIVPLVVGLTQSQAAGALSSVGLVSGFITKINSSSPAGSVISQNPAAGTSAPTGSSVALVISLGPSGLTVPNLIGISQPIALALLEGEGFTIILVNFVYSSSTPAGLVAGQNPPAGSLSQANVVQTLYVSSGPNVAQDLFIT